MLSRIIIYTVSVIFLVSCGSSKLTRMGTGKPKFGSLEVEGVSFFLSSENGTFNRHEPVKLILKVKNISDRRKVFETENNVLLVLQVKNEYRETLLTLNISAERFLGGSSFSLDPSGERVFEISLDTEKTSFAEFDSIYCQVRLFFLPKQFRRNTLSIYLDRK